MSSSINRQEAIEVYGDWYVEEGTEEGFIGTVKQLLEGLPPEPESIPIEWISEKIRLIEESGVPLLKAKAADYRDLIAQWKVEQANPERNYNEEIRKICINYCFTE